MKERKGGKDDRIYEKNEKGTEKSRSSFEEGIGRNEKICR